MNDDDIEDKWIDLLEDEFFFLPRYAPKAFIAKEILSLLYVLPREQILRMDLTWLRRRDLRLIYREIKRTYPPLDMNKINIFG